MVANLWPLPRLGPSCAELPRRTVLGLNNRSSFMRNLQSYTKILGHSQISGAFSDSHRSNPSPHPTNNIGCVYPVTFPSLNFVHGGVGRTARKFRKGCTVLLGNQGMTEKYEYCRTVPRIFVHDCSNCNNKHFMTGPERNSLFPENLTVPQGGAGGIVHEEKLFHVQIYENKSRKRSVTVNCYLLIS